MRTELVYYIVLLLYKEGKVSIPGLGQLSVKEHTAHFSGAHGTASPPYTSLEFTPGKARQRRHFSAYVAQKTNSSERQIQKSLKSFGKEVSKELNKTGSVEVPDLGVFEKSNRTVLFTPAPHVANLRHRGLGRVAIPGPLIIPEEHSPVVPVEDTEVVHVPPTPEEVPDAVVAPVIPDVVPAPFVAPGQSHTEAEKEEVPAEQPVDQAIPPEAQTRETTRRGVPLVVPVALLAFVAVCIIAFVQYKSRNAMMYPVEAYNRSPIADTAKPMEKKADEFSLTPDPGTGAPATADSDEQAAGGDSSSAALQPPGEDTSALESTTPDSSRLGDNSSTIRPDEESHNRDFGHTDIETESPSAPEAAPVPSQQTRQCYVVVGAFGVQANVQRMADRLTAMGYQPVKRPSGQLTQVAVPAPCDSPELQQLLDNLQTEVEKDAWVLDPS